MPRLVEELTADFSAGMFDSVAPTAYPKASAALIYNGRIEPDGTISRRSGTQRTHPTALVASGTGYGGTRFTTAAGTDQMLAFFGTQVFVSTDYGATWNDVTPTSALSFGATGVLTAPMDPDSWADVGTPLKTVAVADPWAGTDAILLTDDDAGASEGLAATATYTTSATKAAVFVLAPGTAGTVWCEMYDATAAVLRNTCKVEWDGTDAPTLTNGGLGDVEDPVQFIDAAGRKWWIIEMTADGVVHTNTNQCRVVIGDGDSSVGTVYLAGAEAWDAVTADFTPPATILLANYYSFATMRVGATMYLFAANGDTTVQRWNGTIWDTLTNAPSGVKYLAVHNGRLYVAGHSGVIVQGSKIADPTIWTSPDALTVQIMTHGGEVPTGMYQVGPHLLIYDQEATSYVDGFGEQTIIVAAGATGFSRSVGCAGFRTIAGVGDNGVCWLSRRGVEYYTPGAGIRLISKPVEVFLGTIDWEQLYSNPGRPSAAYDEVEQDYYLAMATNGTQNDRVLVLNLQQNVDFQRSGPRAAATIDVLRSASGGTVTFGDDGGGYLGTGIEEADADASGYLGLADAGGDPITEDASGYLTSTTNNTLPATLFPAPATSAAATIYSLGYDGFVRRHSDSDLDDWSSTETEGTTVDLTIVSRPFLFRRPRQRKRVRAVHIASLQDASATLTIQVRAGGAATAPQTVSMSATGLDQAQRKNVRVKIDGDTPQVQIDTSDDVRISLVGISGDVLRESI
ncbi:MAG TPA: hypothetical protein VMY42_22545 [Thermoguttaceae bacterium]|nr:hypothetical protein [Thermoguttaceae bacterium]